MSFIDRYFPGRNRAIKKSGSGTSRGEEKINLSRRKLLKLAGAGVFVGAGELILKGCGAPVPAGRDLTRVAEESGNNGNTNPVQHVEAQPTVNNITEQPISTPKVEQPVVTPTARIEIPGGRYDDEMVNHPSVREKMDKLQRQFDYWAGSVEAPYAPQKIDTGKVLYNYYVDETDPKNWDKVIVGFETIDLNNSPHRYIGPIINGEVSYESPDIPKQPYSRDATYGEVEVTAGDRPGARLGNFKGKFCRMTGATDNNSLVVWEVVKQREDNPTWREWQADGKVTAESIGYHRNKLDSDYSQCEFGTETVGDRNYQALYGVENITGKRILIGMEVEPGQIWQASKYEDEATGFKGVVVFNRSWQESRDKLDYYLSLKPDSAATKLYGTFLDALSKQTGKTVEQLKIEAVVGGRYSFKVPTQDPAGDGWWVKWVEQVENVDPKIMEIRASVSKKRPEGLFVNEKMVAAIYANGDNGYIRTAETLIDTNHDRLSIASWFKLTSVEDESIIMGQEYPILKKFVSERYSLLDFAAKSIGIGKGATDYYHALNVSPNVGQQIFTCGWPEQE